MRVLQICRKKLHALMTFSKYSGDIDFLKFIIFDIILSISGLTFNEITLTVNLLDIFDKHKKEKSWIYFKPF